MKRNIPGLANRKHDLIIIGGGIFGICAGWEAVKRGLSVALLEKGDFAQATSSNHFKMAHCGIRYLQHADILRIRESSNERSALLKLAPHLVHNKPIVIPTYGHGIKSKEFLQLGLLAYDLFTWDRNKNIDDPWQKIPRSTTISKKEVIRQFPNIKKEGLTGGAVFYDGQIYNPPRLALSFLRAAVSEGLQAANYLVATGLLLNNGSVSGVTARDLLTGDLLEISGDVVLNAAGPWANSFLDKSTGVNLQPIPVFSRDLAFVVPKKINETFGLTFPGLSKDADALVDRGGRHIFFMPWRESTLIGVWHKVYRDDKDIIDVKEEELVQYLSEVNAVYPDSGLDLDDISMVNTGLTLFGQHNSLNNINKLNFGKRSLLVDHETNGGIKGLVSLIGVRATTARGMAQKTVDMICGKLGKKEGGAERQFKPIFGGNFEKFKDLSGEAKKHSSGLIDKIYINPLLYNYGSNYVDILNYIKIDNNLSQALSNSTVLKAEILHAIREEMAHKLTDVVLRRTDLGTAGDPGEEALNDCAKIMADELEWDEKKMKEEVSEMKNIFLKKGRVKDYRSINRV